MTNFLGEFECKVDAKGRILLPSNLKKQLSPAAEEKFVLNRGFEKHLVLYPMNEWKVISGQLSRGLDRRAHIEYRYLDAERRRGLVDDLADDFTSAGGAGRNIW